MSWEPDPIAFVVGGVSLRYAGFYLVMSFVLGFALLSRRMLAAGRSFEDAVDFMPFALLGALAGGRVGFFVFEIPRTFFSDPFNHVLVPGFSPFGVGGGLLLGAALYTKRRDLGLFEFLDWLAVPCAAGATLMALSVLFDRGATGIVSDSFGLAYPHFDEGQLEPPRRFPTPFLAAFWATALCGFAWAGERILATKRHHPGQLGAAVWLAYFAPRPVFHRLSESKVLEPSSESITTLAMTAVFVGCAAYVWYRAGRKTAASPRVKSVP